MSPSSLERARRLFCALQDHIRETLVAARARQAGWAVMPLMKTSVPARSAFDQVAPGGSGTAGQGR